MTSALSEIAALPDTIRPIVLEAFTSALNSVFLAALPFMVVGFVFALILKDSRLRSTHAAEESPPGQTAGVGSG
jgi:ABC-type tungstate transport system substrate-binding protein